MDTEITLRLDPRCGEQHANTDIYCAKRQRSLVAFPVALVSLLIIGGVAAFLLTGFVGYQCVYAISPTSNKCFYDPWANFLYLKEPWAIYLWASAVVLTVQVAILRNASRRRLVQALLATLFSIGVVGIAYLFGGDILQWLKDNYKEVLNVVTTPNFYTILNFAIVALYVVGSLVRWVRHPDGLKLIGIRAPIERRKARGDEATLDELIAGDLITGVVLFFIMSLVFTSSFVNWVITKSTLSSFLTSPTADVPASLSVTDTVLALFCLFMGFMSLALTGLLAGLRVLQDQNNPASSRAAGRISTEVVAVIFNALRAAITRQIRGMVRRVGTSTRRALWPLLLLGASFCLALFGRYVLYYLHYTGAGADPATETSQTTHLINLLLAIALGLGGVVAAMISTALQMRSWRVAANAFGFLRWVGLTLLITLWIFAVALFAFDNLLLRLNIVPGKISAPAYVPPASCPLPQWYNVVVPLDPPCNQPFIPLSYPTLISFVAFLVVVGILLVRLRQGVVHRVPSPSASTSARGLPIPRASASSTARGMRPADTGR